MGRPTSLCNSWLCRSPWLAILLWQWRHSPAPQAITITTTMHNNNLQKRTLVTAWRPATPEPVSSAGHKLLRLLGGVGPGSRPYRIVILHGRPGYHPWKLSPVGWRMVVMMACMWSTPGRIGSHLLSIVPIVLRRSRSPTLQDTHTMQYVRAFAWYTTAHACWYQAMQAPRYRRILPLACSHASCNILAPKAYLIRRLRVVPCKKSDLRLVLGPDSAASAQVKGNTRVEYEPCVYGADWLPQCGCGSGGWEKLAGCSGRQGLG